MSDAFPDRASLRWLADAETDDTHALARVRYAPEADVFACPATRLTGDFHTESWQLAAETIVADSAHGWSYRRGARTAFAAIHVGAESKAPDAVQADALDVYQSLFALQRELDLPCVQRIWHWLSEPTAGRGDDERYRRFCRGRAEALDAPEAGLHPLPPATLVAGQQPGLRLHVLLGDQPVTPVENPRQISAYRYPRDYGARAPAFARAGVARLTDSRFLLISGTASIVGHATRHAGDVAAQAREALANVAAVIEAASPAIGGKRVPGDLQCVKAYLQRPADTDAVITALDDMLPAIPRVLLHAPLCRDDLLVEFEAQMALD